MIQRRSIAKTVFGLAVAVWALSQGITAEAMVINGDFASGLTGWFSDGPVSAVGGAGTLSDDFPGADLYQGMATGPGSFVLEFDFLGLLSSDLTADPFAFPDTFFASLLFIDDYSQFDLASGSYDDSVVLFDMDDLGVFNAHPNATISSSPLGGDWQHFSMAFASAYEYAIPVFELWDFNYVIGDSEVQIDNVSLTTSQTPIPEPATSALLALGIAGLIARRKGLSCRRPM